MMITRSIQRWILFGALGLTLSACGGDSIYHSGYGRYSASTALTAAPDGEMALAVYGSPAPGDQAALAQTIAKGLNGTHIDYETKFVPTTSPNLTGYRTAVVFGPTTPEAVCTVSNATGMAEASPTSVTAGFCLGDEVLSYTTGHLTAIKNVEDPALVSYMRYVGHTLFPIQNPNYASRNSVPFTW